MTRRRGTSPKKTRRHTRRRQSKKRTQRQRRKTASKGRQRGPRRYRTTGGADGEEPGPVISIYTTQEVLINPENAEYIKQAVLAGSQLSILHDHIPDDISYRNDREFVIDAVRVYPGNLRIASEALMSEETFLVDAMDANADALEYIPDARLTFPIMMKAVWNKPSTLRMISERFFREYPELLVIAIQRDANVIELAPQAIRDFVFYKDATPILDEIEHYQRIPGELIHKRRVQVLTAYDKELKNPTSLLALAKAMFPKEDCPICMLSEDLLYKISNALHNREEGNGAEHGE
jgi:hypothetical protein